MISGEEIANLRAASAAFAPARAGIEKMARSAAGLMASFKTQKKPGSLGIEEATEELLLGVLLKQEGLIEAIQLLPGALGWVREAGNEEGKRRGLPGAGDALANWIERGPRGVGSGTIAQFLRSRNKPDGWQPFNVRRRRG